MRVLLTNDDGVQAVGMDQLVQAVHVLGWDPVIVAPAIPQSGTSRARKEGVPVAFSTARVWDAETFAVHGTPAECVLFALHSPELGGFDACISGINAGENLGADLSVSGTFGAAHEAWAGGLRACAVSRQYGGPIGSEPSSWDWSDTAQSATALLEWLFSQPDWSLVNANLPNAPTGGPSFCDQSTAAYFTYRWNLEEGAIDATVGTHHKPNLKDDVGCFVANQTCVSISQRKPAQIREV